MDDLRKQFNEKWQWLCEEYDGTRDAFFEAVSVVNQKFATTGDPTQEELDTLDAAEARWNDAKRQMDETTNEWLAVLRKMR